MICRTELEIKGNDNDIIKNETMCSVLTLLRGVELGSYSKKLLNGHDSRFFMKKKFRKFMQARWNIKQVCADSFNPLTNYELLINFLITFSTFLIISKEIFRHLSMSFMLQSFRF